MLYSSKRKDDMKAEQELCRFLDDYFYNRLKDEHPTVCYERQHAKHIQMDGIDVVVKSEKKPIMYINEKVSIYYRNTMLPTFAFEINSIQKNSGERVPGWFVNKELKTSHYLLVWANIKCDNKTRIMKEVKDITTDDFTIIEVLLINKNKIIAFSEEQGFSIDRIINEAEIILSRNISGKKPIKDIDDFYFYYSTDIAEKPVNIIIKRKKLLELATVAYYIGQDGLAKFK